MQSLFHDVRYAGRLWHEANWDRLLKVLDAMVAAHVAWDPTLDIYEASRDLQRARTQPWFADYLHPALEEFFRPNPASHGSYFSHWTSTDETFWKENYRIWMAAVREFGRRGGLIKVLWHDGQGMCLFAKRLERGRFLWPSPADGVVTITPAQLGYLLEGIDWRMPQHTWRPQAAG